LFPCVHFSLTDAARALTRAVQHGLVIDRDSGSSGDGTFVVVVQPDAWVVLYGRCRATHLFTRPHVDRGNVITEVGRRAHERAAFERGESGSGRPRDPTHLVEKE
jgi:hypothetical protein